MPKVSKKKKVEDEELKDENSVEETSTEEAPVSLAGSEWKGEGNPKDGQLVTLGEVVYRFMSKMEQAFDVQIGSDAKESLDNLKKAVDQTGQSGLHYFEGTRGQSLVPLEITL